MSVFVRASARARMCVFVCVCISACVMWCVCVCISACVMWCVCVCMLCVYTLLTPAKYQAGAEKSNTQGS